MAQPPPLPGEPRLSDARRRRRSRGHRAGGVPATGPNRRRSDRRRPGLAHGGRRSAVPRPGAVGARPARTTRRAATRSMSSRPPSRIRPTGSRSTTRSAVRCWRCCGGCHPVSGSRSSCTTSFRCRSRRSPRRWAGPSAPAANSPGARAGKFSRRLTSGRRGRRCRTSARHREDSSPPAPTVISRR